MLTFIFIVFFIKCAPKAETIVAITSITVSVAHKLDQ